MADIASYKFPLREVAEALVRKQGIKSGLWTVIVNFGVGNVTARTDKEQDNPGIILGIEALTLIKVEPGNPQADLSYTIDASSLSDS
ncbi:hypothetical protein ABE599_03120 [Achromobacter mucicolens]|uniref:hypothetical protein n=1 Tax=Achromobacter mucicolens TaxID=1389922 RepID=UPI003207A832